MADGNAATIIDTTEHTHNVRIRDAGIKYPLVDAAPSVGLDTIDPELRGRTVVDVYSQGGSILGMREMIDALADKEKLDVTTAFKFNGASGRIEINFPTDSGLAIAQRLDAYFKTDHPEYVITHSFEQSFANAVEPIVIKSAMAK